MIARAPYLYLLLILIPDLYLDWRYWRHKYPVSGRLIRWLPSILLAAYTIVLSYEKNFIPDNPTLLWVYLILLGLIAIPKAVFMLCSIIGLGFCSLFHKGERRRNYGNLMGLFCVPVIWYILIYGSFIGFNKLEVNRQDYSRMPMSAAIRSATNMSCIGPSTASMPKGQTSSSSLATCRTPNRRTSTATLTC